jgi:decaprenylphospho-beta-D-ribofuranose 2-oxidase
VPEYRTLTGWGRTIRSAASVAVARGERDVVAAVRTVGPRGAIARGLGRSYGDAAQNAGGTVVRFEEAGASAMELDAEAGTVTAWAGTSIDAVLRHVVPHGWFVPVTPGTRFVTVGGAIAADIHGKNHHVDGSFGNHVEALWLQLADGTVEELGPARRPELFWATVGGMGLTGMILRARFRVLPIETSRMLVDTERAADLDDVLARMAEGDARYRYSVAWLDVTVRGSALGRSVLTRAEHAPASALGTRSARDPLAFAPRTRVSAPPWVPNGVLGRWSMRAFNAGWFRKAPAVHVGALQSITSYFHPLDMVHGWNRLYGPAGFVQYQFVVPFGEEAALRAVIERLADAGAPSFLTVLKRFGPGNPAPLSFPMPGWTLALDLPAGTSGLGPLLHGLDRVVLDAGGRFYLAKDAHLGERAFRAGYPRFDEWRQIRDKVDPTGTWRSDLARRVGLTD